MSMKLNDRQQAFADNYIETLNATESYLKVYTNVKKVSTANVNASRLLSNAKVKAYIAERMEELKSKRIADQSEILEYLTGIMRGEHKEETLRGIGEGAQTISDIDVGAKDRIKAAELLGKRYGMWTEKQDVTVKVPTIVNDVPLDD